MQMYTLLLLRGAMLYMTGAYVWVAAGVAKGKKQLIALAVPRSSYKSRGRGRAPTWQLPPAVVRAISSQVAPRPRIRAGREPCDALRCASRVLVRVATLKFLSEDHVFLEGPSPGGCFNIVVTLNSAGGALVMLSSGWTHLLG